MNFVPLPPLEGGGFTPQQCIFELIDRFWLNLAQMVLSYVGIDWHFQFLNFLPLLPLEGGEGVTPPKVYFWSNRPIFMKFIIKLGTNGLHIFRAAAAADAAPNKKSPRCEMHYITRTTQNGKVPFFEPCTAFIMGRRVFKPHLLARSRRDERIAV